MAKCSNCGGSGEIYNDADALGSHTCPACNGSGQQPEAPAPAAPADLARRLLLWIDDGIPLGYLATCREAAAMLTRQAEQLDAAQTALVDAETVKRERDALRGKIAKLRELAARPGDPCCLRLMRDMLAILDSGALAGGE